MKTSAKHFGLLVGP